MATIVIIGNGIAGSTAARYIRKYSDHKIIMISSEGKFPFSRTALMYIFMGHMKQEHTKLYEDWFWSKNRIELIEAYVSQIDADEHCVSLSDGQQFNYDKLIIATGSRPNKYGWPGQDLDGVQGLYHIQDLEQLEHTYKKGIHKGVIVGGGLIGIELAEMLHSRHIPVTFLVREKNFWSNVLPLEESMMISSHIMAHGIDLKLNEELLEIKGHNNNVCAIQTKNSNENIPCDFVGITVGVSPNISFLQNTNIKTNKGILVNNYLQTSIEDIYAIGDCAELISPMDGRRSIEAVWYTGKMMGITVAQNICNQAQEYNPGIWYNSAKFFDIEYQVYGDIPAQTPDSIQTIHWQHPSENKSIRINYSKSTNAVTGFNLMGIRYRHAVCDKWIKEKTHIELVLRKLSLANFDPEFFQTYESEIIDRYNQVSGRSIQLDSKQKLKQVVQFLNQEYAE